ncbi:hypothetical protein BD324DRAFT_307400 [Kockovaella imperatae]|uniref:NAD(P)-binding protein n=1 Tax=Kockovaella imperatae TaxID=4999 RepID=A0A1Y1ULX7_9TREE|nr:hypothetical protein BD324DRAFT_307400 [Kockovaella imperatae]ORX39050.1 hypothetical protein BD324DRAFT_307400 [Kockovaella imperatae]
MLITVLTRSAPTTLRRLSTFTPFQPLVKMVAPAGLFSNRYKLEDMPDLSGQVAIVSGGTRGIGEAVSAALVQKGCEVHILSATEEHFKEAVEHISADTPSAPSLLKYHQIDLHSLKSLAGVIPELAKLPRIDMLYLIAGIGVAPFQLTEDGIGNHFAVNNLSQMMLVDGLLDKIKETARGKTGEDKWSTRIVSESSELHRAAPSEAKFANLAEMSEDSKDMDPTKLYGRSKLANALFIRELSKHLPPLTSDEPILAISVHPGAVATEQQQGATQAYGFIPGAESALWAGTGKTASERREEVQGRYFSEADGKVDTESDQAKDDALAKQLWELSVKTLKDKAGYEVKM